MTKRKVEIRKRLKPWWSWVAWVKMPDDVRDTAAVDAVEQQALIRVKPRHQRLSPFLMLQHFNSVPHSGVELIL